METATVSPSVNPDVCILKHEIVDNKIANLENEINSVKETQQDIFKEIKGVHDLQTTILYAIIFLCGAAILTLIGVLAGRAVDFGVFFP